MFPGKLNSQDNALDNLVGYHWSLTQSSIRRFNKTGVEKLYSANTFIADTPFESGELSTISLPDGQHGRYGQRVETNFARYEYLEDEMRNYAGLRAERRHQMQEETNPIRKREHESHLQYLDAHIDVIKKELDKRKKQTEE